MTTDIIDADTVDTVITDYDLCTNFIADNESDFHVINQFYWDHLMNICSANYVKIHHDSDITSVELIDDVYYNAYDQYDHLIQFDIIRVLYMSDFIINIISMRLTKQWANLFFETQFEWVYNANNYIHATMQKLCNQWVLEYTESATLNKIVLTII